MVSIKGVVIEQTYDNADEHLQKLAKKYLGIGIYYYRKPQHKRRASRTRRGSGGTRPPPRTRGWRAAGPTGRGPAAASGAACRD